MARSEARIFTSIWSDPAFRPLTPLAKTTYLFLVSQPDLSHCGVIPLRPARWARKFGGLAAADMETGVKELDANCFSVTDQDTGELLVRALTRRDKVLRQPKLWAAFSKAVADVESVRLLSVLLAEIARVQAEGDVNPSISRDVEALVARLERHLDCLPGTHTDTHRLSLAEGQSGSHPDSRDDRHSRWHPGSLQGEGERNGSNQRSPFPQTPIPLPPAAARGAADTAPPVPPTATPEGEGDSPDGKAQAQAINALVDEVRRTRPEWSTPSIRRALSNPAVAERPWPVIRAAMLAVAADPESQVPGRLAGDGPWWHRKREPPAPAARPPWCGTCDETTRLTAADSPRRCPYCHPLEVT